MATQSKKIVVGIDGTDVSLAALRWAFTEGSRTGAPVEVVHAFAAHSLRDLAFGSSQELANGSACMLDNEVRAAGVATEVQPVAVVQTSRHGSPATVLAERAGDAALLVLGARTLRPPRTPVGHGGQRAAPPCHLPGGRRRHRWTDPAAPAP